MYTTILSLWGTLCGMYYLQTLYKKSGTARMWAAQIRPLCFKYDFIQAFITQADSMAADLYK